MDLELKLFVLKKELKQEQITQMVASLLNLTSKQMLASLLVLI
jgi:hypothetical protein